MADGKVNVPVIGETNKSTLFIAGLAGLTALGWTLWKDKKTKAASTTANAASAATASQAATAASGYGYGAYAFQPYGYGYGPEGLGAYGGQGDYGYGYYGAGEPVNEEVPGAAATNAQWSEAAMTALTAAGWTGADVLTALGLYITGSPVSATQQQIIQAAIAAEGYPPAPGASGYPPAINTGPATGQSGTSTAGNPQNQSGTISGLTKNGKPTTMSVTTTNAGVTWNGPGGLSPGFQTGNIHSSTTNENADVTTHDGGKTWGFVAGL